MKSLRIVDNRMPAFCWQEKAVLRDIRKSFKTSEIVTAMAVYTALTEVASNKTSDEFEIKRLTLSKMLGRSESSIDYYLSKMVKMGIIKKKPLAVEHEYRCLVITLDRSQRAEEVYQPTGTPVPVQKDTCTSPLVNGLEEHTGRRTNIKKAAGAASWGKGEGEGRKILRTILHGFPGDLEENIDLIFDSTPDLISASTVAREAARWAERGDMRSPKRALETVIQQVLKKRRKS